MKAHLLRLGTIFLLMVITGCGSSPGPDSISTQKPAAAGAPLDCIDCHSPANPSLDPLQTNGTGPAGKHVAHVTGGGFACTKCHFNYTNQPTHMNGTLDTANPAVRIVYFDATNPTGQWIGDTGPQTGSCSSLYCHSDGTFVVTGVLPNNVSSPTWYGTVSLTCNSCHGYPPSYPQMTASAASPKANAHEFHIPLFNSPACQGCHYATTTTGGTITDPTKHVNGQYDVTVDPGATDSDGLPVTFTYRPDPGGLGGFCDNVSCHGGFPNTAFWGKFLPYISGIASTTGPGCFEVRNFNIPAANFTNTAFPITYKWDFGNDDPQESGTAAGAPVVSTSSHTYLSTGPFTVTFTGRDALNRSIYKQQDINPQPIANVIPKANASITNNRYNVTYTDLSTDPDYSTCGHSGNGRINISGNGFTTINQSIYLTDQPSGTVFTFIVSPSGPSGGFETIYYIVCDNQNACTGQGSKTLTMPGTTSIGGIVTTNAGAPLATVTVNLKDSSTGALIKSTTTATDGTYSFSGTWTAACFTIEATKTGYTFSPQTVCISRNDVNFTAAQ